MPKTNSESFSMCKIYWSENEIVVIKRSIRSAFGKPKKQQLDDMIKESNAREFNSADALLFASLQPVGNTAGEKLAILASASFTDG